MIHPPGAQADWCQGNPDTERAPGARSGVNQLVEDDCDLPDCGFDERSWSADRGASSSSPSDKEVRQ
jgi:hypothetical protein